MVPRKRSTTISRKAPLSLLPFHGALGLTLIAVSWPASWLQVIPVGQYSFFPLWLGYILTVDALVLRRTGSSLLTRNLGAFLGMFLVSVPMWWVFEGINYSTQNWHYLGAEGYSKLRYVVVASWHFSIVVPAVFETAELVTSFESTNRFQRGPPMPISRPCYTFHSHHIWRFGWGTLCIAICQRSTTRLIVLIAVVNHHAGHTSIRHLPAGPPYRDGVMWQLRSVCV